ncbi:uncharacterized protein LOC124635974 [Helicoverpa zea]|uniref:uncharacterized protein LOC124635974 n=1 Tax=Helicoverpa zea TaxID=7113 RepID=UPI001F591C03|nr:uncharacterized protein LOC124635974 [Helicoverpa zea]
MATITQTVQEYLPKTQIKQITSPRTKPQLQKTKHEPQALGCPVDCPCKTKKESVFARPMALLFNAIGILVALIATYMIVTTNSNIYLVFWVAYSVLRRLSKSRSHIKSD